MGYDMTPTVGGLVRYEGTGVDLNEWAFRADLPILHGMFDSEFLQHRVESWGKFNRDATVPPDLTANELFEDYVGQFDESWCDGVLGAFLSQFPWMRQLVCVYDAYGNDYLFARDGNHEDVVRLTDVFGQDAVGPLCITCLPDEED